MPESDTLTDKKAKDVKAVKAVWEGTYGPEVPTCWEGCWCEFCEAERFLDEVVIGE
jgi:hypothetical protein